MSRHVVYLDHSVLSVVAKDSSSKLSRDLTGLVETGKVVFPYSWTHHYEAELDSRHEEAILQVGGSLSRGVHFLPVVRIVAHQARRAYMSFTGDEPAESTWREAYEHDPRGEISPRWRETMLGGRVATDPSGRERRRAVKDLFADGLSKERDSRTQASYGALKNKFARDSVELYFADPWRKALRHELTDLDTPMLDFSAEVSTAALGYTERERTPLEHLEGTRRLFDFFASEECRKIPFIDIQSSILASLEIDESSRPYSPGDFYDVETWSAYLPYVDMAVADSHMHQVLSRRSLASRFGCSVFPHTQDALRELVAGLEEAGNPP